MEDYEDKRGKELSEFNEMTYQIQRIHNKFLELAIARRHGNFTTASWILDEIEVEFWYDAEKLDKQEHTTYIPDIENFNKEIRKNMILHNFNEVYRLLIGKEKLLRKVQNECGKGARYRNEDDDDMWD